MAAKKKSSAQDQWDAAVKAGAIRPTSAQSVEAFSKPGQAKPTGGVVKTMAIPPHHKEDKIVTGLNAVARTAIAVSGAEDIANAILKPSKGNVTRAAIAVGTIGAAKIAGPVTKAVVQSKVYNVAEKVAPEVAARATPVIRATRPITGMVNVEQAGGKAVVLSGVKRTSALVKPSASKIEQGLIASQTAKAVAKGSKAANVIAGMGLGSRLEREFQKNKRK